MKAIGYKDAGPLDRDDALVDIELERPIPGSRDLLVEVEAISVNPVDTKVRGSAQRKDGGWKVLGWDVAGTVVEVGQAVTLFKPGDSVFYAGAFTRPGANSQFHLVDERIVGLKPASLLSGEAAALPLTALTAWEMLFDRLRVYEPVPGASYAILIIGGAGGVGSIAIQLLRAFTDLTVIATASRQETKAWVTELGAHAVIDHSQPLAPQVEALGMGQPAFVLSTAETRSYLADIIDIIAPQGRFGLIDDPAALDIMGFKTKSVSVHWEMIFTRSLFETPDMVRQGEILGKIAEAVDSGKIRSTINQRLTPINAANIRKAHEILESGKAKGKIVIEAF